MDCSKVGQLIFQLRKEKGLTQRQVADAALPRYTLLRTGRAMK